MFALERLLVEGHTVVVIEHCLEFILCADWIIELGPGAGIHGGKVLIQNTLAQLMKTKTNTGLALNELITNQSIKTKTSTLKKNIDLEKKKYSLKMLVKIIYQTYR